MALSIKVDRSQLYCNIGYNNRDYGAGVGGRGDRKFFSL